MGKRKHFRAANATACGAVPVEASPDPVLMKLETIGMKLRGVGHLIETQRPHDPPIDLELVQLGVGAILNGLGEEVQAIWRELDQLEVKGRVARAARKGSLR